MRTRECFFPHIIKRQDVNLGFAELSKNDLGIKDLFLSFSGFGRAMLWSDRCGSSVCVHNNSKMFPCCGTVRCCSFVGLAK